jgi:hypothetical protein
MKLGTLISVSGAIDFPQEHKFHDIALIEQPRSSSQSSAKPARKNRPEEPEGDRFARIFRWIVVALLSLSAVA